MSETEKNKATEAVGAETAPEAQISLDSALAEELQKYAIDAEHMKEYAQQYNLNEYVLNLITPKLEEKYKKSFTACAIGGRFNYKTATVYYKDEAGVTFRVVADSDTLALEDNYIRNRCMREIEAQLLEQYFAPELHLYCKAKVLCDDCSAERDDALCAKDFFEKYHVSTVLLDLFMCADTADQASLNSILDSLLNFSRELQAGVAVELYIIEKERFEECISGIDNALEFSDNRFHEYFINTVVFSVKEQTIYPEPASLAELLHGKGE
ncbi:MAG: hypothetical protein IKE65_01135 [Clostridia bacterium]|nr:hypothetical protein [Clostridia bacterium]